MYLLLLAGFSNYNNRTIRKAATPDLYASIAEGHWYVMKEDSSGLLPVNFKPNDGVSTAQIINDDLTSEFGHEPDYLIAFDDTDTSTECVVSRWFILEIRQTRKGQRELILRRDLIADYYEELKTADVFVERGLCNLGDPLIFNDEGMVLNKIKKSERLIQDESLQAWIVGYMDGENSQTITFSNAAPSDYLTIEEAAELSGVAEDVIEDLMAGSSITATNAWGMRFNYVNAASPLGTISQAALRFSADVSECEFTGSSPFNLRDHNTLISSLFEAQLPLVGNEIANNANAVLTRFKALSSTSSLADEIRKLENLAKPIEYDGQIYEIKGISFTDAPTNTIPKVNDPSINAILTSAGFSVEADGQFELKAFQSQVSLIKELNRSMNISVDIGGSAKPILKNRPYRMFCIPTGKYRWRAIKPTDEDPNPTYKDYDASDIAFKLAAAIQRQASDSAKLGIYDLQLLPYCPIRQYIHPNVFAVDRYNFVLAAYAMAPSLFEEVKKTDGAQETMMHIFYCETDSFTYSNEMSIPITDAKFESNCKSYRLCSPNYQGAFDFNAAKNEGVSGFLVKCTYKPYTPFIRVAPIFAGLYGQEFNDQRGLICGGNFSMTQASSAWAQYELNNKNYQNIFNREIQSLDTQQSVAMRDQIIKSVSGTIQMGIQGAMTGAMVGGPWGAAAGAAIGTAAGAAGGALDTNTLALLQKDQRSLAVDKFNYQLGNIRAIPDTLTKIDAFDISSKIFPFLEEYGPTDEEEALFKERVRLQSYTIMRIEKLGNQMTEGAPIDINDLHYVKGQLIRTDNQNLMIDSHQWDEIYAELSKGVYL